MSNHFWSEEEDNILRRYWNSELPVCMWETEILGRSPYAIRQRARHLGLGHKVVNYGAIYPQVYERADAILNLLKHGPLSSAAIQKALEISESQFRRSHAVIRSEVYIFAWEMGARGGEWPIWAIGNAPDAKRPPKGDSTEYNRRYREKNKRPSRAKPKAKETPAPIVAPSIRADIASSWMFNRVDA